MNRTSILELHRLQKTMLLDEKKPLFQEVTATIKEPSIIAVLGVSGQGKSTLLRIIGLLDTVDEGSVRYRGRLSTEWRPQEWRMKVSYVAQQSVMLPGTVEDNLRAVSYLHRLPFDQALAARLMGRLGMRATDWKKQASDLSGGEKQRVALVRSMLLKPEVFLLDEITASLDLQSKQAVQELLAEWHKKEGTTHIWVTHDLEQAKETSHQVWFMGGHTLLEQTDTASFFLRPESSLARRFLQISMEDGGEECPILH